SESSRAHENTSFDMHKPTKGMGSEREDSGQSLLWHLLYFYLDPYVMLHPYLDESGTQGNSPAMCVAGVFYSRSSLRKLDRAWKRYHFLESRFFVKFNVSRFMHGWIKAHITLMDRPFGNS